MQSAEAQAKLRRRQSGFGGQGVDRQVDIGLQAPRGSVQRIIDGQVLCVTESGQDTGGQGFGLGAPAWRAPVKQMEDFIKTPALPGVKAAGGSGIKPAFVVQAPHRWAGKGKPAFRPATQRIWPIAVPASWNQKKGVACKKPAMPIAILVFAGAGCDQDQLELGKYPPSLPVEQV
jgi:hypothetical protein